MQIRAFGLDCMGPSLQDLGNGARDDFKVVRRERVSNPLKKGTFMVDRLRSDDPTAKSAAVVNAEAGYYVVPHDESVVFVSGAGTGEYLLNLIHIILR